MKDIAPRTAEASVASIAAARQRSVERRKIEQACADTAETDSKARRFAFRQFQVRARALEPRHEPVRPDGIEDAALRGRARLAYGTAFAFKASAGLPDGIGALVAGAVFPVGFAMLSLHFAIRIYESAMWALGRAEPAVDLRGGTP